VENIFRSKRPIDGEFIGILGSSARGLFALEYALFDQPRGLGLVGQTNATPVWSAKLLLEGPTADRRRQDGRELAWDLGTRLRSAAAEGRAAGFVAKFAASGQDGVNLLVNQVLDGVEIGLLRTLNDGLAKQRAGKLRYDAIQGEAGGTSSTGLQAV